MDQTISYQRQSQYAPLTPLTHEQEAEAQELPVLPYRPNSLYDSNADLSAKRRSRPNYLSFAEAVEDGTQPDFDPNKLYTMSSLSSHSSSSTPDEYKDPFSKLPSPSLFPNGLPKPARKHPFSDRFEAPDWGQLMTHVLLCFVAYPILLIFVVIAKLKPLFWVRLLVGAGCGIVGFLLGLSLINLGKNIFEAATWATIIHQSQIPDGPGIKLEELKTQMEDSKSAWGGFKLLWDRNKYPGAQHYQRKSYDRRPWTLYIIFFLLLVGVASSGSFVFGRIVEIDTEIRHQSHSYTEVAIKGDSSPADIERANSMRDAFESFIFTWTLSPFSVHGNLPPVVQLKNENETVYFSETISSQLLPNGTGLGTFSQEAVSPSLHPDDSFDKVRRAAADADPGMTSGTVLRYPRWGIRIHCTKIPDPEKNILPKSNATFTYLFTPRETLRSLFDYFNLSFPAKYEQPFNTSRVLQRNDTLPPGVDIEKTAFGAGFFDNGVAHSLLSDPATLGQEGTGWVTVEHILVRLNTSYTPNGKFGILSNDSVPDEKGNPTFIGYDAAVCLQLYEPWVLDVYNGTAGAPNTLRIVEKGSVITDAPKSAERRKGPALTDPNVSKSLNSSLLAGVYIAAHQNSVNQILKDNGRDAFYVPSQTIISLTDGYGPTGYTELNADRFALSRALSDASNVLPYFAGSGSSMARSYPDAVLASASILPARMITALGIVLILGLVAAMCVPRLPLSVPKRGFELYSWLAAFHADELVIERPVGMERQMTLDDIAERMGQMKFQYTRTR